MRLHALLAELPDRRAVAALILGKRQHGGHGGLPGIHSLGVRRKPRDVLLREGVKLRRDLAAFDRAYGAVHQRHARAGDPAVSEWPDSVRPEDDRREQRVRYGAFEALRRLPPPEDPRFAGDKIRLRHGAPVLRLENGVPFGEQVRDGVNDAGRVAAVDHLHPGIAVRPGADVDKAARGDQRAENGRVEQNVRVVLPEDLVHAERVVPEFAERHPVCQGVHGLAAPAERGIEARKLRRRGDSEVPDGKFHLVVAVSGADSALF